jgi:hypothetical protein
MSKVFTNFRKLDSIPIFKKGLKGRSPLQIPPLRPPEAGGAEVVAKGLRPLNPFLKTLIHGFHIFS